MATYELSGTVKAVMDTVKFDSGFIKREFVVTTPDDRYFQNIKFECVKDKCALLDKIKVGQQVPVSFDIRGNDFKRKYFVSLSAWKIEPIVGGGRLVTQRMKCPLARNPFPRRMTRNCRSEFGIRRNAATG